MHSQIARITSIFMARRWTLVCCWLLAAMYIMAVAAPWLAPHRYDDEARDLSYCPPTTIELMTEGRLCAPFVYGRHFTFNAEHRRIYEVDRERKYPLRFFANGKVLSVDAPGRLYFLGADGRGRDILSRLLYGARISLSIGLLGTLISFSLALIFGGIAGYYGGWVDSVIMRCCEALMLVPGFYLLLALRSAVPSNFSSVQVYLAIVVILSLIGWASMARVIRGMALTLRQRDYVAAAKLFGLSDLAIIIRHILPHTFAYTLAVMMLSIPGYILAESGLSLLGLGIQDPLPSWGNMLSDAMGVVQIVFSPWILWPGLVIFITVICFNVVGDALRDALDPMLVRDKGVEQ